MSHGKRENGVSASTVIGTLLTVASGVLFYSGYRDQVQQKWINETPQTQLGELEEKLRAADGEKEPSSATTTSTLPATPLYVKVTGKIHTDYPITAEHSKEKAAIYEKHIVGMRYDLFYRKAVPIRWLSESWRKESPFYIHDSTGHRVFVKPFSAAVPSLQVVHSHDDITGRFWLSVILGIVSIPYPYKYEHTEHTLPLGKDLFVMGNATRHRDGSIKITAPPTGVLLPTQPGVVSLQSEQDIVASLDKRKKHSWAWGSLAGAAGVALFVSSVWSQNGQ